MGELHAAKRKDKEQGRWRQFLAAFVVNLASVTYGVVLGWSSPTISKLQSEDSPIGDGPLTDNEVAWLNAICCLSAILVLPLCSILSERFGRKYSICLISVPFILCQLFIIFGTNYMWLFFGRAFAGIAYSMTLFLLPIYVGEISCDSMRGILGSMLNICLNIGLLIGYTMGDLLSYKHNAIATIFFPLSFLIGFIFMPETPIYLIRTSRIDDGIRSLMWLKNNDELSAHTELCKLQRTTETESTKSIAFMDLFKDRGTRRAFTISTALLCGQVLSGVAIIATYTASIFKISGSTLRPNLSAIVIGIIQVLASCLSIPIIERVGRRTLIFISSSGMFASLSILGCFMLAHKSKFNVESLEWLPLCALSTFIITYCIGMGSVPFVIAAEVFQPDIVSHVFSICLVIAWTLMFIMLKFYPLIVELIDNHGCFFLYAFFCMCTFLFTWIYVPETKGRTLESILNELNGSSKTSRGTTYVSADVDEVEKKPISGV